MMEQIKSRELHPTITCNIVQRAAAWFRGRTVATRRMRHVETLSLGQKRSLYLVECAGSCYLVAAGGDCISTPVRVEGERAIEDENGLRGRSW